MELLKPSEAASRLGVSYATLKQWIYRGTLASVRTPGGHHRIPLKEVERISRRRPGQDSDTKHEMQAVSGRNKLRGTIVDVRYEGLFAQILLDVDGQTVTSIITRGAAEEMELAPGMPAVALIKATQVMILKQDSGR
jgi:molybdopterin-binding protein